MPTSPCLTKQLPLTWLSQCHTGSACRLRLIRYPAVSIPSSIPGGGASTTLDIRAGAHSDYGSLTLLFQQPSDTGGLQVQIPSTEAWLDVRPVPDSIVVNIGDALEFWTAGRLRSTLHRVVFPRSEQEAGDRHSIPFFVQPDSSVLLRPLLRTDGIDLRNAREGEDDVKDFESVLRRKGYMGGEALTAGQHLQSRIAATY